MSNSNERIAAVLKSAIKAEEEGFKFYQALALKADNDTAKRKLEGLRDDEVRHNESLRKEFKKHIGEPVGDLPEKGMTVLSELFARGEFESGRTEMEYINLAIETELAAARYYQKERNLVDDPAFVALFDKLAEEEHAHYELLQAEKDAIGGNYHWFGFDDSSPMEH